MATLVIHDWHTECSCGYNAGNPMARKGDDTRVVLTPEMVGEICPGCGEEFTGTRLDEMTQMKLDAMRR